MPSAGPIKKLVSWLKAEDDEEDFDMEESPIFTNTQAPPPPKRQRGPLTLHGSAEGGMQIRHPRSLEERNEVGSDLKQRRMVTLNLTRLADADARYFLEFIYGVVFALDATIEKVTDGIYVLAPHGVAVHNEEEASTSRASYPASHATAAGGQEELFWQGR